jgi:hypothetical protein
MAPARPPLRRRREEDRNALDQSARSYQKRRIGVRNAKLAQFRVVPLRKPQPRGGSLR